MIGDKQLAEIKRDIPTFINEGLIARNEDYVKLSNFFAETAEKSLNSARFLFKASTDTSLIKRYTTGLRPVGRSVWYVVFRFLTNFCNNTTRYAGNTASL